MALNNNQIPVFAITPKAGVGILNAATAGALGSTTNAVTVFTAASLSGSRISSLMANTDDTAAVNLFLSIVLSDGATVLPLGIVNVPLSSGNAANTLNIDCLDPTVLRGIQYDESGKPYLDLPAGSTVRASTLANMTSAKKCYVTAIGADYQ